MSIPHTGRLIAEIEGQRCEFDGDTWRTASVALAALLNRETARTVKQHFSIKEVAERVLADTGLSARARIMEWHNDTWPDELPPGAVD